MEDGIRCHACGDAIVRRGLGRPRKFCERCAPPKRTASPIGFELPPPPPWSRANPCRSCDRCGMVLVAARARHCAACRRDADREQKRSVNAARVSAPVPCEFCGWTFSRSTKGQRFCSTDCGNATRGTHRRFARFTVFSMDRCESCERFWPNTYAQTRRCPPCDVTYRRALKSFRNATARGASGNLIDIAAIFERDGWVCQLCNSPVLRFVRHPHPRSPSIDHILPVALGGQHVESNVQLAHLGCNSAKGDRVAA